MHPAFFHTPSVNVQWSFLVTVYKKNIFNSNEDAAKNRNQCQRTKNSKKTGKTESPSFSEVKAGYQDRLELLIERKLLLQQLQLSHGNRAMDLS